MRVNQPDPSTVTRAKMEADYPDVGSEPLPVQLERIVAELDQIVAALDEPSDVERLARARDAAERTMYFTEAAAFALSGDDRVFLVVGCHKLIGRMRWSWGSLIENRELWAWVRRDVAEARGDLAGIATNFETARGDG